MTMRSRPVSTFRIVMVSPGNVPPERSVAGPRILPVTACAASGIPAQPAIMRTRTRIGRSFMASLRDSVVQGGVLAARYAACADESRRYVAAPLVLDAKQKKAAPFGAAVVHAIEMSFTDAENAARSSSA